MNEMTLKLHIPYKYAVSDLSNDVINVNQASSEFETYL